MIDKDILKSLKQLKRKYYTIKLVKCIFYGIFYYSIALLLMMVLSKIVPIPYIISKSIKMFFISMLITLIYSIYRRPKDVELAKAIDSFGLEERVVTSLQYLGNNDDFSLMQKKDTLDKLKDENLTKKIKIEYPKKILILTVVILSISTALGFINTNSVHMAKNIEENKQTIEEKKENVDKIINETKQDKALTQTEKKEIENNLKDLKKRLDKSKELRNADKDILKSKKELEKLRDKLKNEKIEKLAKELSKKDLTKNLSKEILNKNQENISKEMKNIEDKLKNMDKKDLEKAIDDLKDLEKSIENEDISNALNNLANSLKQDMNNVSSNKMSSSLANLSDQINNTLNSEKSSALSVSNAISTLEGMVSQSESSLIGANGSGSEESSSGSGSGSGKGSGQGSGVGSGSSSDTENEGGESSSEGNSSKTESDGGVKNYEKIHTPKNLNGEGYDAQISGIKGNDGEIDNIQVKQFGEKVGEAVPYNEVLNNYKKSAYEKMDSKEIPPNMKDVVKKYFIELD